jgi:O-antigen ligase
MLRLKSRTDKYSLFIMVAFFAVLLIKYAKGINYDFEGSERNLIILSKESSKAPFLIITTIILFLLNKDRINFKIIANYKLWAVFFICLLIISFLRDNVIEDLNNYGNILFSYLILLGLMRFTYRIKFSVLEDYFILVSFLILVLCVAFHLLQGHNIVFFPDRSINLFERLGGMFYYAHTAAISAITLLFSLIKYLKSRKVKYLIVIIFSFVVLIATDTRSAWVGVVFSLIFIFFKNINFYKIFWSCIGLYLIAISYSSFVASNQAVSSSSDDSQYRMQIWFFSLNLASQNLFTGYGGADIKGFSNFAENDNLHDPHNSLISLLLQSGLIALVIYLVIYFKNCNKCNSSYNTDYRFLYFFWFFFAFFWGHLFSNLSSFINTYLMFTIYAFTLNPNSGVRSVSGRTK